MLGNFSCMLVCWLFSKITFSNNSFSNTTSLKQFRIQIRTDILLLLIWVQTVCNEKSLKDAIWRYDDFQSRPLMNLYSFATVHGLVNNTDFDWQLQSSFARAICFEHHNHSPDVTLVLWLTASHTWVAHAKQASCLLHWLSVLTLAVPLFRFTPQQNR